MNKTQKQLLQLVSHALFGCETEAQLNQDVIEEAKAQAVQGLIDPMAYQVFSNNLQIVKAHARLCTLLDGIPFVIIKGCASAYYYPKPMVRSMGDVDFYVEQEYFEEVERKLIHVGFLFEHETEKHRCFYNAGISHEMHCAINGAPKDNGYIQQMLEDTVQTSVKVSFNNDIIRIPDDFHNGLICLLHICRHLSSSEVGLRHFCDWACFVNNVSEFETLFKEKFERVGLWTCARIFSLTAVKYLGISYQSWMGAVEESVIDSLIDEIMDSGNMGRKRTDYEMEWFVDKAGSGSKTRGIISSLNRTTKKRWPVVKHCPLLYPFGWIFFSARYLIRSLLGKRRILDFREIRSKADKKNKLLEALQLFRV